MGAVDYRTGKIYNKTELDKAIAMIKKYEPQNISKISRMLKLLDTK